MIATVTAFCACSICTSGLGLTASGRVPVQGVTVAAPAWVPFGTRVKIEGVGWRVVQDRMARRYRWTETYDIYFARHEDARAFGARRLRVTR